MKFPALRRYIKDKNQQEPYSLKDRDLVIDGNSFFKNSYKDSGCQFVLGTDCDRYADYLISKLAGLLECNIKCHVIFKGSSKDDTECIQEKQQRIIDDRKNIKFYLDSPKYFDPLLVTDVQKQVLKEMGIKYFCCEYDSMDAIVGVARVLKCPVVTDNIEYCLFKVSCILPDSIVHKSNDKAVQCVIYEHHKHQAMFGVFLKTPILLTLMGQNKDFMMKIPELYDNAANSDVRSVIRWVKRQPKNVDVSTMIKDEATMKAFKETYERIKILFLYPSNHLAIKYFRREKAYGLFKDDKKWFAKGVADGRIGHPYIDVKRKGLLTGSDIVNDVNKTDAMLAAHKIIAYTHQLLINSQTSTLNFIGRKGICSSMWEINTAWNKKINNSELFNKKNKYAQNSMVVYNMFFKGINPGHDLINILINLKCVPQSCWMLICTLVYYLDNVTIDFIDGAHFILLSYLLLGPVSETISEYKEKGESVDKKEYEDAKKIYDQFKFLFRKVDLQHNYNTSLLHSLAEFQHCLQHMNYLNNLCGEANRGLIVPSTVYHDTYNATLIYNAFITMRNKDNMMTYLNEHFDESHVFVELYKNLVYGLEMCRNPKPQMTDDDFTLKLNFFSKKSEPLPPRIIDIIQEIIAKKE